MPPSHPFFRPACVDHRRAPSCSRFPSLFLIPCDVIVASPSSRLFWGSASSHPFPLAHRCHCRIPADAAAASHVVPPPVPPPVRAVIPRALRASTSHRRRCGIPDRASASSRVNGITPVVVVVIRPRPRCDDARRQSPLPPSSPAFRRRSTRVVCDGGTTSDVVRRLRRRQFACCVLIFLQKCRG